MFMFVVGIIALIGELVESALLGERIGVRVEYLAERRVAELLLGHCGDGGGHLVSFYLVVASRWRIRVSIRNRGYGFVMGAAGLGIMVCLRLAYVGILRVKSLRGRRVTRDSTHWWRVTLLSWQNQCAVVWTMNRE